MTQFKDKSSQQRELVSAGLFFYPVLMAADVLAYRAHEVPVGDDQRQHVELMRDIAQRFNARFGEELVVPGHRIPSVGARIMDLQDPKKKMSTTGGTPEGTVYVLDTPKDVEKKFKRAVTDSADPPAIHRAPDKPGISNLIDVLAVSSGRTPEQVEAAMADARGYGDLKVATAQAVNEMLEPVRARYAELRPDEDALEAVLTAGADKARVIAADTLADVRRAMGIGPRPSA
jgi:tryptophanyl-tRNA synthetase